MTTGTVTERPAIQMCTSLQYMDSKNNAYFGRTLELDVDEPWVMAYVPPGVEFESQAPGSDPVTYTGKHGFIAVTERPQGDRGDERRGRHVQPPRVPLRR
jgi:penicillin V acylase-like amidase (Ntn superfamily)